MYHAIVRNFVDRFRTVTNRSLDVFMCFECDTPLGGYKDENVRPSRRPYVTCVGFKIFTYPFVFNSRMLVMMHRQWEAHTNVQYLCQVFCFLTVAPRFSSNHSVTTTIENCSAPVRWRHGTDDVRTAVRDNMLVCINNRIVHFSGGKKNTHDSVRLKRIDRSAISIALFRV